MTPPTDPKQLSIDNHFILKSLDLTAPGGYVIVLTSRYTLDGVDTRARRAMAARAGLLSARLASPANALKRVGRHRGCRRHPGAAWPRPRPGRRGQPDGWLVSPTLDIDDLGKAALNKAVLNKARLERRDQHQSVLPPTSRSRPPAPRLLGQGVPRIGHSSIWCGKSTPAPTSRGPSGRAYPKSWPAPSSAISTCRSPLTHWSRSPTHSLMPDCYAYPMAANTPLEPPCAITHPTPSIQHYDRAPLGKPSHPEKPYSAETRCLIELREAAAAVIAPQRQRATVPGTRTAARPPQPHLRRVRQHTRTRQPVQMGSPRPTDPGRPRPQSSCRRGQVRANKHGTEGCPHRGAGP